MGTFKIKYIAITAICSLTLVACSDKKEQEPPRRMISVEQYENTIQEYRDLSQKQEAIIQQNIENDALINDVVKELRSLTTATMTLRMNVESGTSSISKSDEIKMRLDQLKKKLNAAQKTASTDSQHYIATIQNLRNIIEQKENEIIALKEEIVKKNNEIKSQTTIINTQQKTIKTQQNEMLQNQMNSWFTMGKELKDIASVIPAVKGKKDKNNISNTKLHILERAKICFDRAAAMGHPTAAQESQKISTEIRYL